MSFANHTPRFGRARRRSERSDPVKVLIGGVLAILAVVGIVYVGIRLVDGVPGVPYTTLYVDTPQVGNLLPYDPVRIDGVQVGEVIGRAISSKGDARIAIHVDPGVKLHQGTTIALRADGLLGARYVQLIPGHGSAELKSGSTLTGGADSYAYGVPEALDTFNAATRYGLGKTINGLGQGFLGHGSALNGAIHQGSTAAQRFNQFATTVLSHDGAAARLVPALDAAVEPLDENRTELGRVVGVTPTALAPLVTHRDQVRQSIADLPTTLGAITANVPAGDRLVDALRSVSVALDGTLPRAPAGLTSLSRLLSTSKTPLVRATALLKSVAPAVPAVLKVTSAVSPVLSKLSRGMTLATPVLDLTGKYECDFENFGSTMRSMTGYTEPGDNGPTGPPQAFRLQVIVPLGLDTVGLPNPTGSLKRDVVSPPCEYKPSTYPQF